MTFVNPEYLFLVWLAVPLGFIFFTGIRKRRKILSSFVRGGGFFEILPGYSGKRRILKAFTGCAALVFLAVSASGPEYGHKWQEFETRGVEIILAVDCSRSMTASDIQPTRLDRAKREIIDLLSMLEGDKVGLVAFAGTSFLQCPVTSDYSGFTLFLNALSPDYIPVGGTDLESAITTALNSFDRHSGAEKAVIIITDGEATAGDAIKAAEAAKEKGIRIFCIGVGGETAAPVPEKGGGFKKDRTGSLVLSKLDEESLKRISDITGGTFVRSVAGDMDLDVIYRQEIRGKMEQSIMRSGKRKIPENRFQWPLFIAVALMFLDVFMPSSRKVSVFFLLVVSTLLIKTNAHAESVNTLMESAEKAYNSNNYEKAVSDLIAAQVKEPESPEIFYNLGNTYYRMGKYDAALKSYSGAIESGAIKKSDPKTKGMVHYNLGNTKFRIGDYQAAVKEYEKALELNPEDVNARDNIEIAKKMMEQKKQEQKQNQSDQDNKDSKDSKGNKDNKVDSRQGSDRKASSESIKESGSQSEHDKQMSDSGDNLKDNQVGEHKSDENDSRKKEGQASGNDASADDRKNNALNSADEQNRDKQDEGSDAAGQGVNGNVRQGGAENPGSERKQKNITPADIRLNWLQDRPGAAMIPAYRQRNIEKDW
jgi:Ca-activated chloride channel family protein